MKDHIQRFLASRFSTMLRLKHSSRLLMLLVLFLLISSYVPTSYSVLAKAPSRELSTAKSTPQSLQFLSGGQALSFDAKGVFIAGTSKALRVEFVNAQVIAPVSHESTSVGEKTEHLKRVEYQGLWQGIDLVYDAVTNGVVRSTYTLATQADPTQIGLRYNVPLKLDQNGSLHIVFQNGEAVESAPIAWQEIDGKRTPVRVAFKLIDEHQVGFSVGAYNRSFTLFIDPTLTWNTFFGGPNASNTPRAIVVDAYGNVYVTGSSSTGGWEYTPEKLPLHPHTPIISAQLNSDIYVAKFDMSGNILWYTFLGGSKNDYAISIILSNDGGVIVAGNSYGEWDTSLWSISTFWNNYHPGSFSTPTPESDAVIAKLNTNGALQWFNFLGSSDDDALTSMTADASGNIYITGGSNTKTPWGNPLHVPATIPSDMSYGSLFFLAKLSKDGFLTWSTFYNSPNSLYATMGKTITVDSADNSIYVAGTGTYTPSCSLCGTGALWGSMLPVYAPLAGSANNGTFVSKFDSSGTLTWYTFAKNIQPTSMITGFGGGALYVLGSHGELDIFFSASGVLGLEKPPFTGASITSSGMAADAEGNLYITGSSSASWGTPMLAHHGGLDAFVAQLSPLGDLLWNTFLGSDANDSGIAIALSPSNNILIAGSSPAPWGAEPRHTFSQTDGGDHSFLASVSPISPDPLVILHGYLGTWNPTDPFNPGWAFTCQNGIHLLRPDKTQYNPQTNKFDDASTLGDMPGWFKDAGYDVWVAHYESSKDGTPNIAKLTECLKGQIETVEKLYPHRQITLVGHSMGGVMGRAIISSLDDPKRIKALYAIGSPQAGVTPPDLWFASRVNCAIQVGFCQLSESTIYNRGIEDVNSKYPTVKSVKYSFIGGSIPLSTIDIFPIFPPLQLTLISGDTAIGAYSAVGWDNRTGQVVPTGWTSASVPGRFWTDENHNAYHDGTTPSHAFYCIQAQMDGQEPSNNYCHRATASTATPTATPISSPVSTSDKTKTTNDHLDPNTSATVHLDVDTNTASTFVLSWAGAGIPTFTLTRPGGQLIDKTYVVAHPSEVIYQAISGGQDMPTTVIYQFSGSQPVGDWQLNITSTEAGEYGVYATLESAIHLDIAANQVDPYHPGDNAVFTAHLKKNGSGLTGATVTAALTRSDGVVDTITLVSQGNGDYTGTYTIPNTPGFLNLEVLASGTDSGSAYTRQENALLSVAPNELQLTNSYSETPIDADSDGLYEKLNFSAGVNLTTAGEYVVTADLYAGDQPVAHSGGNYINLAVGTQTVTIPFNGVTISEAGLDGPYMVTNLSFEKVGVGIASQQADNVLTTAAYNHNQFGKVYYTIAGNAGQPDVTLSYSDPLSGFQTVTSDANGDYSFTVPYHWSGKVVPYKMGYAFSPANRDYTTLISNQNAQNYTATAITYTISGNTSLGGVTLTYTPDGGAPQSITSDVNGNYSLTLPFGWYGTITPSLSGHTFRPASLVYKLMGSTTNQDYVPVHTISGNIGVQGVLLSYSDNGLRTAVSNPDGSYSLAVSDGWSGTVTPSLTNYEFTPTYKTYANVAANLDNQNYAWASTITPTPTIIFTASPTSTPTYAPVNPVELVSVDSNEIEGNSISQSPSISKDGRYVVFSSTASNLVANDTNGVEDVFVRDLQLGTTERVSLGISGAEANGISSLPTISPDGRYIGFVSYATNLVANDTNGVSDAFLYDRQAGQTIRMSINSNNQQGNNWTNRPSVSPDGNYWVFMSQSDNLTPDDTTNTGDIFMYNQTLGTLQFVSPPDGGLGQGNGNSTTATVSNDGRYVVYQSAASNLVAGDTNGLVDIFRYDTQTKAVIRVSVDSAGQQANGDSERAVVSADGRYIVFGSTASNLVMGDNNRTVDIFLRDTVSGTTTRISVADNGQEANGISSYPAISSDGRYVEFSSTASNLVTGDTNGVADIFIRDLQIGKIRIVSVDASGAQGNDVSDGRASFAVNYSYLVYTSSASNLVTGDLNGVSNVFAVDFGTVFNRPYVTSTPAPTATRTATPITPTPTWTATPITPTATWTATPVTPTPTWTATPVTPTATWTATPVTPTPTWTATPIVTTFPSIDTQDGWILESAHNSAVGGTMDSGTNTLIVGDDASNRQFRSIVSFGTAPLPDNAIIQSAVLRVKYSSMTSTNPFTIFNYLFVDMRQGHFGSSSALELSDFVATADAQQVGYINSTPSSDGWYSINLNTTGLSLINLLPGGTQFRLRFAPSDNGNSLADNIRFLSGDYATNQPQLIITYTTLP